MPDSERINVQKSIESSQASKANQVDWANFETEFAPFYSHLGKPSKPVRLMVGLSILKHLENLSDEVLIHRWTQNPYYPSFSGEVEY